MLTTLMHTVVGAGRALPALADIINSFVGVGRALPAVSQHLFQHLGIAAAGGGFPSEFTGRALPAVSQHLLHALNLRWSGAEFRALADIINTSPDPKAIPGAPQMLSLLAGTQWAAFFAAVCAAIVGGAVWAWAGQSGNYQHATRGKTAVFAAVMGAVLIGAGPHLIQWFFDLGAQVR